MNEYKALTVVPTIERMTQLVDREPQIFVSLGLEKLRRMGEDLIEYRFLYESRGGRIARARRDLELRVWRKRVGDLSRMAQQKAFEATEQAIIIEIEEAVKDRAYRRETARFVERQRALNDVEIEKQGRLASITVNGQLTILQEQTRLRLYEMEEMKKRGLLGEEPGERLKKALAASAVGWTEIERLTALGNNGDISREMEDLMKKAMLDAIGLIYAPR